MENTMRGPHAATPDEAPLAWGGTQGEALLLGVLDEIDYAVMLLDEAGRLLLANEEAWQLLRRSEIFGLIGGRPQPVDAFQVRRWRAMLQGASRQERCLEVFGGPPDELSVALSPLQTQPPDARRITLVATFGRQRACAPISLAAFARSRRLTKTESSVLESLVDGRTPLQIAAAHRVAISTVRTQIKNVLVKTGNAGMRELLTQMARLAPLRPTLRAEGPWPEVDSRTRPAVG